MAQPEVGPNDIVIHLVNPYKCGDCGSEFCSRTLFLDHLGEHLEKLKNENLCYQIMCGTSLVEQQPNGITVTRDILQINENQMFELQDPSIDYSQLTPLRALEQAGILRLPPKRPAPKPLQPKGASKEHPLVINLAQDGSKNDGQKISLLGGQQIFQEQGGTPINVELLKSALSQHKGFEDAGQISVLPIQQGDSQIPELDALVQQALFGEGKVKAAYSITIESPAPLGGAQSFSDGGTPGQEDEESDKSITSRRKGGKRSTVCPVCSIEFANANCLERHQVVHTGAKPYSCTVCFKTFNDVSSLRKHSLIHKREHRCPVCHRMYLRRPQLDLHMKQHDKRRFIQFGNNYHEVRVSVTRNPEGQLVQEYNLLSLSGQQGIETASQGGNEMGGSEVIAGEGENQTVVKLEVSEEPAQMTGVLEKDEVVDTGVSVDLPSAIQREVEQKKKVIYKCGHCKKLIFTRPTLSRHLIRHTNTRPFHCEHCPKRFRDKADLFHHHKTHTKPVQCKTCGSSFSKTLYLQNHLKKGCPITDDDNRFTVLPDLRCKCNVCHKILKNKANILRHLRVHAFDLRSNTAGQTDNETSVLEQSSIDQLSQNVEDHFQALDSCVGFQCLLCGQEFRFKSMMITHVRMHLNQRPYKCQNCPKSFFARHMLKKHQQNHTRPYKCPVCEKGFIRRYLMKAHFAKRHENEDPMQDITELHDQKLIQCDICGKTMKSYQKSLMLYHIRLHKDVRPFQCKTCQKSFISDNALKKHSLNHSRPYKCQVCNKGFSRRYLLTDHFKKKCARSKGARSKLAQTGASTVTELEKGGAVEEAQDGTQKSIPDVIIDEQPYEPTIITQVDAPTGATTYVCDPCDKRFTQYDALIRHVNTFARATPCKHCKTVFRDKHLTVAHQRSCLGMSISRNQRNTPTDAKGKSVGEQQAKVQKIMKEVNETIETITSKSVSSKNIEPQQHQEVKVVLASPVTNHNSSINNSTNNQNESVETPTVGSTPLTRTVLVLRQEKGKFPCPECERSFSTPRGLKIHASSHFRLYKCEVCDKEFTRIENLRAHTRIHREKKDGGPESNTPVKSAQKHAREDGDNLDEGKEASGKGLSNAAQERTTSSESFARKAKRMKRGSVLTDDRDMDNDGDDDEDDDRLSEMRLDHKDLVEASQRLMQSGTRGRPFSCQMCRRRFTEESGLKAHMLQIHGVKS